MWDKLNSLTLNWNVSDGKCVFVGTVQTCPKNHALSVQMDAEGYVHLNVIGRFNRVRALTQDVELIKEVNPANYLVVYCMLMVVCTLPCV